MKTALIKTQRMKTASKGKQLNLLVASVLFAMASESSALSANQASTQGQDTQVQRSIYSLYTGVQSQPTFALVAQSDQTKTIEQSSVVPTQQPASQPAPQSESKASTQTGATSAAQDAQRKRAQNDQTQNEQAQDVLLEDTQISAESPAKSDPDTINPAAPAVAPAQANASPSTNTASTSAASTDASATQTTSQPAEQKKAAAQDDSSAASKPKAPSAKTPSKTPSMVADKPKSAGDALSKKEGDATSEKNLEEVFTASEKRYSLVKKGVWSLNYDVDYSYFRDSVIDIATRENSSDIIRFRVKEESQHSMTNNFSLQYGLLNNLTLNASIPVVAKSSLIKDKGIVGLGDVGLGVRWEPFPLTKDRLPLIFNGNISLPTGISPYNINRDTDIATGRGYYSFGGGVSTRKYIDPVVLFASGSFNYGLEKTNLDQNLGSRRLVAVKPNLGGGIALGFAYSLNYDVSLTMSYQQSFSVGSQYTVRQVNPKTKDLEEYRYSAADQTSATMSMALGVRASAKTIVNTSVAFGLTEDAPDVSLGVSFPLDFTGLGGK